MHDHLSPPGRPFDVKTLAILSGLGVALVAGYVVLAALGRDVSGYVLFLGGPAVTGIVGLILKRQVDSVATAVDASHGETKALIGESVSDLDVHLADQDETLSKTLATAENVRRIVAGTPHGVPNPRVRPQDVFGPLQSGLIEGKPSRD